MSHPQLYLFHPFSLVFAPDPAVFPPATALHRFQRASCSARLRAAKAAKPRRRALERAGNTPRVCQRLRAVLVCLLLCVCVSTPVPKGAASLPSQLTCRGATASLLTLPNEATEDWWKRSGTPEYVPATKLLITLSTFSFLFPWWFMIPSPKPFRFLTQLNCTEARHRTPVETLFNHTVLADPYAFPFHHLPSHRGN